MLSFLMLHVMSFFDQFYLCIKSCLLSLKRSAKGLQARFKVCELIDPTPLSRLGECSVYFRNSIIVCMKALVGLLFYLVGVLFELSTRCKQMVFEVRNRGQHFSCASSGGWRDTETHVVQPSRKRNRNYRGNYYRRKEKSVFSLCSLPAEDRNVSNSVHHTWWKMKAVFPLIYSPKEIESWNSLRELLN